jgi:adenylosuccinate lyase
LLAGRTWLQQASPITLGLKFANWLDAIERHRQRLAETRQRVEVLQFGGAVARSLRLEKMGRAWLRRWPPN